MPTFNEFLMSANALINMHVLDQETQSRLAFLVGSGIFAPILRILLPVFAVHDPTRFCQYPLTFQSYFIDYSQPIGLCTRGNCQKYRVFHHPSLCYCPICNSIHYV